jgi:hypothetical protein
MAATFDHLTFRAVLTSSLIFPCASCLMAALRKGGKHKGKAGRRREGSRLIRPARLADVARRMVANLSISDFTPS